MGYIRADKVLPRELIETIQQYVDRKVIYIPRKEKQEWGSGTSAKEFLRTRNEMIFEASRNGAGVDELSHRFSLSKKSIERILREQRLAVSGDEGI